MCLFLEAVGGALVQSAPPVSVDAGRDTVHDAPVPYLLSAFAAVVYIVATIALVRPGRISFRVALVAVGIEMSGVLTIAP